MLLFGHGHPGGQSAPSHHPTLSGCMRMVFSAVSIPASIEKTDDNLMNDNKRPSESLHVCKPCSDGLSQ